jgi:putative sterol carrier protein
MSDKIEKLEDAITLMEERFNPNAAAGVDAIFQFDISGENGGQYWLNVQNQEVEVHEGLHDEPSITIKATADNYLKMLNGELAPMNAFMQGKVKVKGDMGLAMKLQSMFGL